MRIALASLPVDVPARHQNRHSQLIHVSGHEAKRSVERSTWRRLARTTLTLQLKALKAGARCRVTRNHPPDHGRLSGAGHGPAYAMPSPFEPDGRHAGWIGSKTL